MGGDKDSSTKCGVMRGHCYIGCGREMLAATGVKDSSPGCQLAGGCSWVSFLNCSSFSSLSFLSSVSFREPGFLFISSKERKSHHWKMFFLRVVQYLCSPGPGGGCWSLTSWRVLRAVEGWNCPSTPAQLVKEPPQSPRGGE